MFRIVGGFALSALMFFVFAAPASAQDIEQNEVKIIPYSQIDPRLPHPAHSGARITLKAMIRRADCNAGYNVWWDTNFNGNFDDDFSREVSRNNTTDAVWDIGRNFLVPDVDRDTSLNVNVRVRNRCNNQDKFATMRLFIYDFEPSSDPVNWSDEQIEIMTQMGIQEALWNIHRTMGGFSARNTTLEAHDQYAEATGMSLWAFTINGHQPAYPPESMGEFLLGVLPDGFIDENAERWHNDPYAESAMRMTNYLAARGALRGIPGGEEETECGYMPDGRVRVSCGLNGSGRLDNPGENQGAYAKDSANVYRMGVALGGLSTVLPALNNTPLRVGNGNIRGNDWEWYIQQMVDQLGAQQIDCGDGEGGWLYQDFNGCGNAGHSDGSTTQWAYIGLESAEIAGGPYGVFVNNRHKYRIAQNLIRNQRGDGGAGYRSSSGRGDFKLTGGSLVGARWLGIHQFNSNDGAVAFPGRSGHSRGTLRQSYDRYVSHLASNWNNRLSVGSHWADSMWREGDRHCGNRNAVYNAGRCGSSYAMYSLQKGFRTGSPELEEVGNHDWVREFNSYYVRAQDRHHSGNNAMHNYSIQGRIQDDYCDNHSVTCSYGGGRLAQPMGALVLTPSIFNPKPVAIAEVVPDEVTAGCAGGNSGLVEFIHGDSFHPNPESRIVAYRWDVNDQDGLWWEGGGDPDFETPDGDGNFSDTFEFRYPVAGDYTATLQIVDNLGQAKTTTVRVRVIPAANVAPAAAHGGPYVVEEFGSLELNGSGSDQNEGCGDEISITWDIDGDGQYDDAQGARPTVVWGVMQGLRRDQPNPVSIRVTDSAGESATADTTLTIYPREPVAEGRAQPNPAACQQEVVFDGSQSYHPNPQRSIARYDWNVDGEDGFDGVGERYTFAYQSFGTYDVVLRVTDDLGRTDDVGFQVVVNQGNRAPVARIAEAAYVVLEGDDLVLDGRGSSDDDQPCGDSIVSYEWDINGDGDFDDQGLDATGANPTIPWAVVLANMDGPADRDSGLPSNTVRLRVTDEFGVSSIATTEVARYEARPIAVVTQTPDPAAIGQRTGRAVVTLDGRESFSPVPGNTIESYEWIFDSADQPAANAAPDARQPANDFQKVFPLPLVEGQIPPVSAWLRVTDNTGRTSNWTRYAVRYDIPPTPPTADADPTDPPEANYHILVGESVTLDGSQSLDPDPEDSVTTYRWDIAFANDFEVDITRASQGGAPPEARVEVSAQELAAFGAADAGTYVVRLEVEDGFGLTGTDDAELTLHAVNPVAAIVANPNPVACGARVSFDASGSDHPHPQINIAGYSWDLDNDGEFDDGNGETIAHRFEQFTFGNDRNTVAVRVEDSRGNVGTANVDVAVNLGNRPPSPTAGGFRNDDAEVVGAYAISTGEGVTLSAAGSSDPDAACGDRIVSYAWQVNARAVDSGEAVELSWAQLNAIGINGVGEYEVRVTATDRFGETQSATQRLLVVEGPTAVATATPNRTGCSNNVTFSAENSVSNGPDGQGFDIVLYEWDFDGDGEYDDADGPSVTRAAIALPGQNGQIRMTASLRITDESNRTGTTTVEVVIDSQNVRPVANAGGPYSTGPLNGGWLPVTLDGRGSVDPNEPCDEIVTYKWDTDGDGRYGRDGGDDDPVGVTVQYTNPAWRVGIVQTVRLIVCDRAGACSQPGESEIGVLDEAPPIGEILSPRADNNPCFGNDPFNVRVSVSDPEGDRVVVTVFIADEAVGDRAVDTPDDGSPVEVNIEIDPRNLVQEGRQTLDVFLEDDNGGSAELNAGGRILFDRTAPVVTIGNELREGVCYNPNQVPAPDIAVEDADPNPSIAQQVTDEGCGRTLVVTATDSCGNEGTGERAYLIAEPVDVSIEGPAERELVRSAQLSWSVIGPAECASRIESSLSRVGGDPAPYAANTPVEDPGEYTLALQIANCNGAVRGQTRSFIVNGPPVADPQPRGHPNGVPGNELAYTVAEGGGLQVDGSESTSPEADDSVVEYRWDWNGDGDVDASGAASVANFPTDEDGVFNARLTVVDSLGLTGEQAFRVTVTDVDPVANPGGPYVVPQGVPLEFDGSGSQAGSPADPISSYEWDYNDGTDPDSGADLSRPTHTFAENGTFNVQLTVNDEDSSSTAVVRVLVRDVDPIFDGLDGPAQTYEIARMRYQANARAGAPGDPITRYEWDFDGDGDPEHAGADLNIVQHQFHDAGSYNALVTVRDGDSRHDEQQVIEVREITMLELIEFIGVRIEEEIAAAAAADNLRAALPLAGLDTHLGRAAWGEENGYRGNTLLALIPVIEGLAAAQENGINFGLELWAMGRQLNRSITRQRARIVEGDPNMANDTSVGRADVYLDDVSEIYDEANFKSDVSEQDGGSLVAQILVKATEAFYWLSDAEDPCYSNSRFPVPDVQGGGANVSDAAEPVNADVAAAMTGLQDAMANYRNAAGAADNSGPGVDEINAAHQTLGPIMAVIDLPITFPCPDGLRCVTDREALDMELQAMSLVHDLNAAEAEGVWVRNWQACMTHAVKFRIEISLLRVEFLCGQNLPYIREARQVQSVGLDIFDEGNYPLALEYYATDERKCMMIDIFNRCIAVQARVLNDDGELVAPDAVDVPEVCDDEEEEDEGAE